MANDEKRMLNHSRNYLLDVAVLLLLVLSLLAVWQRHNLAYVFEGDRTQRSYFVSFELVGVRRDTAQALEANSVFFVKGEDATAELGVLLSDLTVLPRTHRVLGENGVYQTVLMPIDGDGACVNAAGTLSCHGTMREGRLLVGDTTLEVGEGLLVICEGLECELRVVSLSENR